MFLYCSWQLVLCCRCPFGGAFTPPFISKGGQCYKEGNRVGYNMISIRTLSLLAYFIDIAIYALWSTHGPLEASRWWAES
jgi:hypothetical protein